jgi:hypothetical protein
VWCDVTSRLQVAGNYIISFEFMHMVDSLARFASIANSVDVIAESNMKRLQAPLSARRQPRRTVSADGDLVASGVFRAVPFDRNDSYAHVSNVCV